MYTCNVLPGSHFQISKYAIGAKAWQGQTKRAHIEETVTALDERRPLYYAKKTSHILIVQHSK